MSNKHIEEVDELLNEQLPDDPGTASQDALNARKQEMIELLQHSKEELGRSPSIQQFNSMGFDTSGGVIKHAFGSWNAAKQEAGLEVYEAGAGGNPSVDINEDYFKEINTIEKTYWLGTLIAVSSIKTQSGPSTSILYLSRTGKKKHFVLEFCKSIDSDYSINEHSQGKPEGAQHSVSITNAKFIRNLVDAGYSPSDKPAGGFPDISEELRTGFLRGFLESNGYFTTGGWSIRTENRERAETLQAWFEEYGVKRPTISENMDNKVGVRVSNIFDIKTLFEALWPDGLATEPCYEPYPRKILGHLQQEYPYPENVSYLTE